MRDNQIFGIDVAVWQGTIDWARAKADGVDFAVVKATQGWAESSNAYLFTDRYFALNITEVPKTGIKCDVYHYLTAATADEAIIEAEHFMQTIEPYRKSIDLYAAVDVESWHLPTNKALLTKIVNTFCEYVKDNGYEPIVYTNPDFLRNRLDDISMWPLWLALWRDNTNIPSGYGDMKIWQWGASQVNGVVGDVDSNYGFFKLDDNGSVPPEPEDTPDEWAIEPQQWAVENGISDGTFPKRNVTRQEVWTMLYRFFTKFHEKREL